MPINNAFISFYKKYQHFVNIFLLIILTSLVFYQSLELYYYISDDYNNFIHEKRGIVKALITNTSESNRGGNYRPVEVIAHQIDRVLFDGKPFGRHITNLVIHILTVILVYILAFSLTMKKSIALIAGLLFSVHIIHSEPLSPVVYLSARIDSIVALFYILSLVLFIRFLSKGSNLIFIISFITFTLAILTKEIAVTFPIVILIYLYLFPQDKDVKGIFSSRHIFHLLYIIIGMGVLFILGGLIFNPGLVASLFSDDMGLQKETVDKINYFQLVAYISGGILIFVVCSLLILVKTSGKVYNFLLSFRYSIPYFMILFLFFVVRFIVLGGFGGHYQDSEGGNLFLESGVFSFIRDMYGLTGLIWPNFLSTFFKLQIEYTFIFYALTILIFVALVAILIILLIKKSNILAFSYLWIFVTLLPVHNILIMNGGYNYRYLYISVAGFCIFISILLYRLMQRKSTGLKYVIIGFIIAVVIFNSIAIINNIKELKADGEEQKEFVNDLKKYQKELSEIENVYFIGFPDTLFSDVPNTAYPHEYDILKSGILNYTRTPEYGFTYRIEGRINRILNYINDSKNYGKTYNSNYILFKENDGNSSFKIDWLNEKSFTITGINLNNYAVFTEENWLKDKKVKEKYSRVSIFKPLTTEGEIKVAVVKVLKSGSNAKLKIELKASEKEINENLFFVYNEDRFQLMDKFKTDGD